MTDSQPKPRGYYIAGKYIEAPHLPPCLYIVPTPIGNLSDITLRALNVLAAADVIYCEDTRVTRKLMSHFSLKSKLATYNDHNGANLREKIIREVQAGKVIALVSDAGMPLICDPGVKLVKAAMAADIKPEILPGPSAALTALVASGLAGDRFLFAGFVPSKSAQRKTFLTSLADENATVILFETARRIRASLDAMMPAYAGREIAIARELTKLHEEIIHGRLEAVAKILADHSHLKGEIVLVIGPAERNNEMTSEEISGQLSALLNNHSVKDAATIMAKRAGLPRREIYARALELAGQAK